MSAHIFFITIRQISSAACLLLCIIFVPKDTIVPTLYGTATRPSDPPKSPLGGGTFSHPKRSFHRVQNKHSLIGGVLFSFSQYTFNQNQVTFRSEKCDICAAGAAFSLFLSNFTALILLPESSIDGALLRYHVSS